MKKVLVLLLALLLVISTASAEGFNLSDMTTEELVSLRSAVNAELAARDFKEKEVSVPPGRYTVGTDIPAGVYTLTNPTTDFSSVRTYEPNGSFDMGFQVKAEEPVGKLALVEGQTVEILYESVVFKPYKGLGF